MAESGELSKEIREYLTAVNEALRATLLEYAHVLPMSLITMGKLALSAQGKVMRAVPEMEQNAGALPQALPRWPLYVIAAYRVGAGASKGHTWRAALPGAVAVELAMAAADLLDELTDGDPSPVVEQYGRGQALNTANLMLVMAQHTLGKLAAQGGGEPTLSALSALAALQEMLVEAAVGQHLDMMYDRMSVDEVTLEMSAGVTEKKAGALIAGACRVGARLSGADDKVVDLLARLGREVGGIAQLANDVQDVLPLGGMEGGVERKTDLRLRKRTLPIVFTLRDDSPQPNALQRAFSAPGAAQNVDEEELRRAVVEAGGVQFANLIMEVHRQTILEILAELEETSPGARRALAVVLPADEYGDAALSSS